MDARLSRRLVTLRVAGASLLAVGCAAPARRGGTDADPGDAPGQGRGGSAARGNTGINDADPGDPPGGGRGGQGARRVAGVSDADPRDAPGQGRGGQQARGTTGINDADPGDPPGGGRGRRQVSQPVPPDMNNVWSINRENYHLTPHARAGMPYDCFDGVRRDVANLSPQNILNGYTDAVQLGFARPGECG